MTNQDDMIRLIKSISGQANVLTIPRVYIAFTKSHRAALFLSQCVYWSDRSREPGGWFYKSFRDWREELGLNQHAVETCVSTLTKGLWLETKVEKLTVRLTTFYRPNLEKISESIQATLAESAIVETAIVETAKVHQRKTLMSSIKQRLPSETTNTGADKVPRPRDLLFDAIAEVTHTDPATAGASIGKVKAVLLKGSPPYTAEEVHAFGRQWPKWKDKPPTLWQLREQIGIVRNGNGVNHANNSGSSSTGTRPAQVYTPQQLAAAAEINARRAARQAAEDKQRG